MALKQGRHLFRLVFAAEAFFMEPAGKEKEKGRGGQPLPPVEVCLAKSQEPAESFSLSLRTISRQMVSSMVM